MKEKEEFFVPYIKGSLGKRTQQTIKKFTIVSLLVVCIGAAIFAFAQKPFKNSAFDLTTETTVTGIYHESPYPMLRVHLAENQYKNIVLLGFGKSSAHPFLEKVKKENTNIIGKKLSIEGNLIYYNGKTLIQITDDEKVTLASNETEKITATKSLGNHTFTGEIIDPKCYFGVMKPGKGKIHRSCAVRCISGGIPPVFATSDNNETSKYFLITDKEGNPIHKEILPYVGKPSKISGEVVQIEDWSVLKIDVENIVSTNQNSTIYN